MRSQSLQPITNTGEYSISARSQLTCHRLYTDLQIYIDIRHFMSARVRLSVRVFRMGAHNKELHNCNNFQIVLDVTSNGNSFADSVQKIKIISDRFLFKLIEFILLNGLVCERYKIEMGIQFNRRVFHFLFIDVAAHSPGPFSLRTILFINKI